MTRAIRVVPCLILAASLFAAAEVPAGNSPGRVSGLAMNIHGRLLEWEVPFFELAVTNGGAEETYLIDPGGMHVVKSSGPGRLTVDIKTGDLVVLRARRQDEFQAVLNAWTAVDKAAKATAPAAREGEGIGEIGDLTLPGRLFQSMTGADGTFYCLVEQDDGEAGYRLQAYDLAAQRLLWTHDLVGADGFGSPYICGAWAGEDGAGRMVLWTCGFAGEGARPAGLLGFDRKTGQPSWRIENVPQPVLGFGPALLAAQGEDAVLYDTLTGKELGRRAVPEKGRFHPVFRFDPDTWSVILGGQGILIRLPLNVHLAPVEAEIDSTAAPTADFEFTIAAGHLLWLRTIGDYEHGTGRGGDFHRFHQREQRLTLMRLEDLAVVEEHVLEKGWPDDAWSGLAVGEDGSVALSRTNRLAKESRPDLVVKFADMAIAGFAGHRATKPTPPATKKGDKGVTVLLLGESRVMPETGDEVQGDLTLPGIMSGTLRIFGPVAACISASRDGGEPYRLHLVDVDRGSERWSVPLTQCAEGQFPVICDAWVDERGDGRLILRMIDQAIEGKKNTLHAFDLTEGGHRWQVDGCPDFIGFVSLTGKRLAVQQGSAVAVLDTTSGEEVARRPLPAEVSKDCVLASYDPVGDRILVASRKILALVPIDAKADPVVVPMPGLGGPQHSWEIIFKEGQALWMRRIGDYRVFQGRGKTQGYQFLQKELRLGLLRLADLAITEEYALAQELPTDQWSGIAVGDDGSVSLSRRNRSTGAARPGSEVKFEQPEIKSFAGCGGQAPAIVGSKLGGDGNTVLLLDNQVGEAP